MRFLRYIRSIPVSYRVPLLVALLMVAISAVISERVLDRLSRTQERFVNDLAETYLDGLSASVLPAVLREDVWEVFDTLDRSSASYMTLSPIETVVTDASGSILAATDPNAMPAFSKLPAKYEDRYGTNLVTINVTNLTGLARRDLVYQGQHIGTIHATFDVSHLFAERREILFTLLLTNGVLALLFSFGGFLLVRRMIAPMRVLEDHMRAAANGAAYPINSEEIPEGDREVAGLFHGYNALVNAERERAVLAIQLSEEEKLSSLGRLASGMAHEINNPLGGLFNALDTLKRHGNTLGVREASLALIERGLAGIRDVVEAALATYRPERSQRLMTADDLEDVKLLLTHELRHKRQKLVWDIELTRGVELPVKGGSIRQIVLNLLLNASSVTPEGGTIMLEAKSSNIELTIAIGDEGEGMPTDFSGILMDPEPAPIVRAGKGLGLWMVRRLIDDLGGLVDVGQKQSGGTMIKLSIPLIMGSSHAHAA